MSELTSTPTAIPVRNDPHLARILVVDDHPVFRYGLQELLGQEPGITICGHAGSAQAGLSLMRNTQPDLAILDVSLPGTNGIELIKLMRAERPSLAILMLSIHEESLYALRALKAGAKGYLMKAEAVDQVLIAVRKVLAGKIFVSPRFSEKLIFKAVHPSGKDSKSPIELLSDREMEVLVLLGRGKSTRLIASMLNLSVKTVETHRAHIKEKFGFADANEMIQFAVDWVAQQACE